MTAKSEQTRRACVSQRKVSYICFLCIFAAIGGLSACTTPDPLYCDEQTPCKEGQVCNPKTNTCEPRRTDGAVDSRGDAGPRSEVGPADGRTDALKPLGQPCAAGSECQSGFCVDQVCCDASCEGSCRSCALAGQQGSCSLVPAGQDPRQDCAGSDPGCGGSCDGEGSCSFVLPQTECAAPSCSEGTLTLSRCDGAGACEQAEQDCGGYACAADGLSCRASCGSVADCTGTFQCLDEHCANQLPLGEGCGSNNLACASGNCVDGVCCQQSGCGACQRCDLPGQLGHCSAVADDTPCGETVCLSGDLIELLCAGGSCQTQSTSCAPYLCNSAGTACRSSCSGDSECVAGYYCAGTLCQPQKQNGLACGGDHECLTGICTGAEGVCCDRECGSECESCAGLAQCTYKQQGTPCGPGAPYCVNQPFSSSVRQQSCDGQGSCQEQTVESCDPYNCTSSPAACRTSCSSHSECSTGLCDKVMQALECVPADQICYADSSNLCPGAGTVEDSYCKIQSCIDGLKPFVAVSDGAYDEALVVGRTVQVISTGTDGSIRGSVTNRPRVLIDPGSSPVGISVSGSATRLILHGVELTRRIHNITDAVLLRAVDADVVLSSCALHHPRSGSCIETDDGLRMNDVEIYNCSDHGILAQGADLRLNDVDLKDNGIAISQNGGVLWLQGVHVSTSSSYGVLATHGPAVSIERSWFSENGDVGLVLSGAVDGYVANSLFTDNSSYGISLSSTGPVLLYNLTVANNEGGGIFCDSVTTIYNTICRGTNPFSGSCNFNYSNVSGGAPGMLNINADPQFLSVSGTTHYLIMANTSPCVDTGLDAVPGVPQMPKEDYRQQPRYVDKHLGGRVIDIGAVEVQ